MYLLVVVSQWHVALVVRCYDFLSGETRQVERPYADRDEALILEFKVQYRWPRISYVLCLRVRHDDICVCVYACVGRRFPVIGA